MKPAWNDDVKIVDLQVQMSLDSFTNFILQIILLLHVLPLILYLKVLIFSNNLYQKIILLRLSFIRTFPKMLLNMLFAAVGAFTRGQPKIKGRERSIDTRNIKAIQMIDSIHCFF